MGTLGPARLTPAIRAAAIRLRIDSATAEVLRAFAHAGVEAVLLKGASNRAWLEESSSEGRWYADCDLLVRPSDAKAARQELAALGFVPDFEVEEMPAWWRDHSLVWSRAVDGAVIDLHRSLPGVGVDDERAWALLSSDTNPIAVAGYPARAPAIPARALHLALHAAHHGSRWAMGLEDLSRAVERSPEIWRQAAELARALDAMPALVAGLRLVPSGRSLIERLGLSAEARMETALADDVSRAPALTLARFAHAGDVRTRAAIVRHKLIPPATFMRHWSPLARRGRLGLFLAYAWRPLWVLSRLPAAMRGWRKGRNFKPA